MSGQCLPFFRAQGKRKHCVTNGRRAAALLSNVVVIVEGQFWALWRHKPRNGLLRTLSASQKVLRRPVRGFLCTGCTETLFL